MNPFEIRTAWHDQGLLVAVKPQGLATGRGKGENLCGMLFEKYPSLAVVRGFREGEGGLLNRLDNQTGGLVLFACTDESFQYYNEQMKQNLVRKKYIAVCCDSAMAGIPGGEEKNSGQITIALAHHETKKNRMTRADSGRYRGKPREAKTGWRILDRGKGFCLVEAVITKGVRHQIRLHLSLLGLPIAGDRLYRDKASSLLLDDPRFAMHALYCHEVSLVLQGGEQTVIKTECPLLDLWENIKGPGSTQR